MHKDYLRNNSYANKPKHTPKFWVEILMSEKERPEQVNVGSRSLLRNKG